MERQFTPAGRHERVVVAPNGLRAKTQFTQARKLGRMGVAELDQRLVLLSGFARGIGATFCHAIVSALFSVVGSAFASRTLVLPLLPHPPGTGRKISGSASTTMDC